MCEFLCIQICMLSARLTCRSLVSTLNYRGFQKRKIKVAKLFLVGLHYPADGG